MIPLIILIGLVGIGMVLVIYGTVTKNRWGINLDPVFCPRCNTPLPQIREPQTLRQALWGGGTCPACGTEVDKWGRELASQQPRGFPGSGQLERQRGRDIRRKILTLTAVGFFASTLLFNLVGGRPSTPFGWMIVLGDAAGETTVFTILVYVVSMYLLNRFSLNKRGHDPVHKASENPEA